jgi:hypothetical protein
VVASACRHSIDTNQIGEIDLQAWVTHHKPVMYSTQWANVVPASATDPNSSTVKYSTPASSVSLQEISYFRFEVVDT